MLGRTREQVQTIAVLEKVFEERTKHEGTSPPLPAVGDLIFEPDETLLAVAVWCAARLEGKV